MLESVFNLNTVEHAMLCLDLLVKADVINDTVAHHESDASLWDVGLNDHICICCNADALSCDCS